MDFHPGGKDTKARRFTKLLFFLKLSVFPEKSGQVVPFPASDKKVK